MVHVLRSHACACDHAVSPISANVDLSLIFMCLASDKKSVEQLNPTESGKRCHYFLYIIPRNVNYNYHLCTPLSHPPWAIITREIIPIILINTQCNVIELSVWFKVIQPCLWSLSNSHISNPTVTTGVNISGHYGISPAVHQTVSTVTPTHYVV